MFLTCIFAGQVVDTMTSVKIIDRWHRRWSQKTISIVKQQESQVCRVGGKVCGFPRFSRRRDRICFIFVVVAKKDLQYGVRVREADSSFNKINPRHPRVQQSTDFRPDRIKTDAH
jgi:hypothetical protein